LILLLRLNPTLNYKNKDVIGAIHNFSAHGDVLTVRMFLKKGLNFHSVSKNSKGLNDTQLHLAARYANYKVFNELVSARANFIVKYMIQFNAIATAIYNSYN
jgi:hypothetical protein